MLLNSDQCVIKEKCGVSFVNISIAGYLFVQGRVWL
jgi:hypothetical protein